MKKTILTTFFLGISSFNTLDAVAACPLSKEEKLLMEEAVQRNILDTEWLLANTSPTAKSLGFSKTLIGSAHQNNSILDTKEKCVSPTTQEKVCDEAKCYQVSCNQEQTRRVDLWWNSEKLSYISNSHLLKDFKISYSFSPSAQFWYDFSDSERIGITWRADDYVSATFTERNLLSSYVRGSASISQDGTKMAHTKIYHMAFPYVKRNTVIAFDTNGEGSQGLIKVQYRAIGSFTKSDKRNIEFQWANNCLDN